MQARRLRNDYSNTASGGIPGWRSGLAPAFGPGRNPGDPGSNSTSGSRCMETRDRIPRQAPGAWGLLLPLPMSLSLSLSLSHCVPIINK